MLVKPHKNRHVGKVDSFFLCRSLLFCNESPWTCTSEFVSASPKRKRGQEAAEQGDGIWHTLALLDPPLSHLFTPLLALLFPLHSFHLPHRHTCLSRPLQEKHIGRAGLPASRALRNTLPEIIVQLIFSRCCQQNMQAASS